MIMDPQVLVIIMLLAAILLGPILYLCMHLITYIILLIFPIPASNKTPLPELRLDTRVGCPDGLCYLKMFRSLYHDRITKRLGHYPSIIALLAIPKIYRRKTRGKFKIIGDGLAHFEPDQNGALVWEMLEKLMMRFDLIGDQTHRRVSDRPPEGYGYITLFNPSNRNDILTTLSSSPRLQEILNINSDYRLELKGFLIETGENTCKVVLGDVEMNVWEVIMLWVNLLPEARITD